MLAKHRTLIEERNRQEAFEFLRSMRGNFIMSQALYYAIKALESIKPEVHQEKSNIADMQFLREALFNLPDAFFDVESMREAVKEIEMRRLDSLAVEELWNEPTDG